MDEITFLDAHTAHMSPLERALALDAAASAEADAADQRKEAERRAAAELRAEVLRLGNRQAGDPLGQLQRYRTECAAADDEVRDLEARLERAVAKRARIQGCIESLSRSVDEITACVTRAAPLNDPLEIAISTAREQLTGHLEYLAMTRAAWQGGKPRRQPPPFAGRGGVAVRSEEVTCPACLAVGATPEEAFMIHHSDANGNPLAAVPDVPVSVPPDDADRSAAGYGREIAR